MEDLHFHATPSADVCGKIEGFNKNMRLRSQTPTHKGHVQNPLTHQNIIPSRHTHSRSVIFVVT